MSNVVTQARAAARLGTQVSVTGNGHGQFYVTIANLPQPGLISDADATALLDFIRSLRTDSLTIDIDGMERTVQFERIGALTAQEVADAINKQLSGVTARADDDGVSIMTSGKGVLRSERHE